MAGATSTRLPTRRGEATLPLPPGWGLIATASGIGRLFVTTVRTVFSRPMSWRGEFVLQLAMAIRRSTIPLIVSGSFFSFGLTGIYFNGVVKTIGTLERAGGAHHAGYIREVALWVAMMIVAGGVGSAMTADLGARKIREELDALAVLGVDRTRALVVPRVLAVTVAMPLMGMVSLLVCYGVSYLVTITLYANAITPSAYWEGFWAFAYSADMANFLFKLIVCGVFVGAVSCYKGLNAGGGTAGVGRAVNEAVLIAFFGVWFIHTLINFAFFSIFPQVLVLRG